MNRNKFVNFSMGGMYFEYDSQKNEMNIKKHGISFKSAARIFFDYDRIEFYDEEHSLGEERYNTIGDMSGGKIFREMIGKVNEILFVVYTERIQVLEDGKRIDVTRLISARMATNFERGLYYGKYE